MNKKDHSRLQFYELQCPGRNDILTGDRLHRRLMNSYDFAFQFCRGLSRLHMDWKVIFPPPKLPDHIEGKPIIDREYLAAVNAAKVGFSRRRTALVEDCCFMQALNPIDVYGVGATRIGELFFTFEHSFWLYDVVNRLAPKEKKSIIIPHYTWKK